jgi:hypothetical protein
MPASARMTKQKEGLAARNIACLLKRNTTAVMNSTYASTTAATTLMAMV